MMIIIIVAAWLLLALLLLFFQSDAHEFPLYSGWSFFFSLLILVARSIFTLLFTLFLLGDGQICLPFSQSDKLFERKKNTHKHAAFGASIAETSLGCIYKCVPRLRTQERTQTTVLVSSTIYIFSFLLHSCICCFHQNLDCCCTYSLSSMTRLELESLSFFSAHKGDVGLNLATKCSVGVHPCLKLS